MDYRVITEFLDVEFVTFLFICAGCFLLLRRKKASRREWSIALATLAVIGVLNTPVGAYLALGTLEWSVPRLEKLPEDTNAIVVLSGGIHRPPTAHGEAVLAEDSIYRCLYAARIYHGNPERIVFLSGGRVESNNYGPTLAAAMKQFISQQGVSESRIVLEEQSSSTHQNAVLTAKLLKAREIDKVILVTDAYHLPRATACFESQGVTVVPSASRFRTEGFVWSVRNCLPRAGATRDFQLALHEWLGIFWYQMRGYTRS